MTKSIVDKLSEEDIIGGAEILLKDLDGDYEKAISLGEQIMEKYLDNAKKHSDFISTGKLRDENNNYYRDMLVVNCFVDWLKNNKPTELDANHG